MKREIPFFRNIDLPSGGSHLLAATAAALAIFMAIQLAPSSVEAQEFRLNLEGAGAVFLDEPQSERFGPGLYVAVRPGVALGSVVALQWSYSLLAAGAGEGFSESGTAHSLTTGLRLRPFAELASEPSHLDGLFVDFNVGYVRTENLDRLGFDTGVGYNFEVMSAFALGPVVRYIHILQPNDMSGTDPNDAQLLAFGVNLAFGPAPQEPESTPEELECPACPTCEPAPTCDEPDQSTSDADESCPDYDKDGVCDDEDRCPTQPGAGSTSGCPVDPCTGEPLVVLVQFDRNSSGMPEYRSSGEQTMDPVLEAVATAVAQDDSCRVCIVGHASEEGPADHNQKLSEARAKAVQDFMKDRGVPESRIPMTGMGEMCPLVPRDDLPMNRRVEFHRLLEGESCPTSCR